jgi:hypothetical protein
MLYHKTHVDCVFSEHIEWSAFIYQICKYILAQDLRLNHGYPPPFHNAKHIHNHNVFAMNT